MVVALVAQSHLQLELVQVLSLVPSHSAWVILPVEMEQLLHLLQAKQPQTAKPAVPL
jgi:hypothetical protein